MSLALYILHAFKKKRYDRMTPCDIKTCIEIHRLANADSAPLLFVCICGVKEI